jgi:hypothetical protein
MRCPFKRSDQLLEKKPPPRCQHYNAAGGRIPVGKIRRRPRRKKWTMRFYLSRQLKRRKSAHQLVPQCRINLNGTLRGYKCCLDNSFEITSRVVFAKLAATSPVAHKSQEPGSTSRYHVLARMFVRKQEKSAQADISHFCTESDFTGLFRSNVLTTRKCAC